MFPDKDIPGNPVTYGTCFFLCKVLVTGSTDGSLGSDPPKPCNRTFAPDAGFVFDQTYFACGTGFGFVVDKFVSLAPDTRKQFKMVMKASAAEYLSEVAESPFFTAAATDITVQDRYPSISRILRSVSSALFGSTGFRTELDRCFVRACLCPGRKSNTDCMVSETGKCLSASRDRIKPACFKERASSSGVPRRIRDAPSSSRERAVTESMSNV